MLKDYVIKIPKKKEYNKVEVIEKIVKTQNKAAKLVDEVLTCARVGTLIIMPKAPGKPATGHYRKEAVRRAKKVAKKLEKHGIYLRDIRAENIFYDGQDIYLIDFSKLAGG